MHISNVSLAILQIMHHRAYCQMGRSNPALMAAGRAFAATLKSMGLDQADYYMSAFKQAEQAEKGLEWIEWHYSIAEDSIFKDKPVAGFIWVDVKYENEDTDSLVLAKDVDWMAKDEKKVLFYRVAVVRENFWFERNQMIGYDYYDEPVFPVLPKENQRVRVRYSNPDANIVSQNDYVYWSNGWVNRFGFEMNGVQAWQPLTDSEIEAPKVEQYFFREE